MGAAHSLATCPESLVNGCVPDYARETPDVLEKFTIGPGYSNTAVVNGFPYIERNRAEDYSPARSPGCTTALLDGECRDHAGLLMAGVVADDLVGAGR